MQKTIWAGLAMLVLAMSVLVACGGGDDSDDMRPASGEGVSFGSTATDRADLDAGGDGSAEERAFQTPGSAPAPEPGNTGDDAVSRSGAALDEALAARGDAGAEPLTLQQLSDGRIIIYTSWMVVEVEDVPMAAQQARAAIAGLGGLVYGEETTTEPIARTVLTFKVLPGDFDEALDRLQQLGKLDSQQVSTDDVTERVVDLESRILTSEASVERLREFLSNATDLEGIAAIEAQLLVRETELERLRGQLRTLQDQAALATIYVTLTEPMPDDPEASVELVQTAYIGHDGGDGCPGDDRFEAEDGEPITVCFEVENTGNLALTEIEIRDRGLDLDEDDFVILEGSLEQLDPEEILIGYFELDAEQGTFPSPRFTATPVDEDGDRVRIGIEVDADVPDFVITEDTSVRSFSEGLSDSVDALGRLGQTVVLGIALVIPFLWVPLVLLALVWIGRRLTPHRPVAPAPATASVEAPADSSEGGTDSDD